MARPITFRVLRYALIPFEQMDHWEPEMPEPKGRAIQVSLPLEDAPRRFTFWNREHAFVGFEPVADMAGGDRFYFGRLAKRRETGIGHLRDRDVVEISTEDWLPIWVMVDVVRQYLAIEMHARFGRLDHMIRVLQAGLSKEVERAYRHEVVISPVTDPRAFWDVVERYPRIFGVKLRFVSPNFLNTPGQFRRLLDDWKRTFNQTETSVDLRNEVGELRVPEEVLSDPVEYISAGEGDWRLDVEEDGRRRLVSSRDLSESVALRIPRASRPKEELDATPNKARAVLEALREIIRKRDED